MVTPEQLAASNTEYAHQAAVMCWASMNLGKYGELRLLFSIPNGGTRNKIEAARLKATGVKAGVSDLMLPVARGGYHGVFLEMKRPGERLRESQELWGKWMQQQGYFFACCDHWQKAVYVLKKYLES